MIAATLGVTEHELEDAMATGDVTAAAEILGTTPEAMSKRLNVSIAELQSALTTQGARN